MGRQSLFNFIYILYNLKSSFKIFTITYTNENFGNVWKYMRCKMPLMKFCGICRKACICRWKRESNNQHYLGLADAWKCEIIGLHIYLIHYFEIRFTILVQANWVAFKWVWSIRVVDCSNRVFSIIHFSEYTWLVSGCLRNPPMGKLISEWEDVRTV